MKNFDEYNEYRYEEGYNTQNAIYGSIDGYDDQSIPYEKVTGVYGWMFVGLLFSGIAAYVSYSTNLFQVLLNWPGFIISVMIELALVAYLSEARITKLNYSIAVLLFLIFSIVNGFTLSIVFVLYTASSIAYTFFICAAVFGIMCIYGLLTKNDLTSAGSLLYMGLVGIIIVGIVNIFLRSPLLYWIQTFVGIMVFLGLTAYHTQKIKSKIANYQGSDKENHIAITCALTLYLDFVNLLLKLLRLFGRRK